MNQALAKERVGPGLNLTEIRVGNRIGALHIKGVRDWTRLPATIRDRANL